MIDWPPDVQLPPLSKIVKAAHARVGKTDPNDRAAGWIATAIIAVWVREVWCRGGSSKAVWKAAAKAMDMNVDTLNRAYYRRGNTPLVRQQRGER